MSSVLVDLAGYFIDETASTAKEPNKKAALEYLSKFIDSKLSYQEASEILYALINTKVPLDRIDQILNTSDDPIQSHKRMSTLKNGRNVSRIWTKYEDQRLICGIHKFGENWVRVSQFVGNNRTKAQCSQRWYRSLNPGIMKGPWTFEENKQLIELVNIHGDRNWKKVASVLTNRTDAQCRYHYLQLNKTGELELIKNNKQMESQRNEIVSQIQNCQNPLNEPQQFKEGEIRSNSSSKDFEDFVAKEWEKEFEEFCIQPKKMIHS